MWVRNDVSKSLRNYHSFKSEKCFIGTSLLAEFSVVYGKTSERHCTIVIIASSSSIYSNDTRTTHLLRTRYFLSSSRVIEQFEMKKIDEKHLCNNLSIQFRHIRISECHRWFFVIPEYTCWCHVSHFQPPFSRTQSKKKVSIPKLSRISFLKVSYWPSS